MISSQEGSSPEHSSKWKELKRKAIRRGVGLTAIAAVGLAVSAGIRAYDYFKEQSLPELDRARDAIAAEQFDSPHIESVTTIQKGDVRIKFVLPEDANTQKYMDKYGIHQSSAPIKWQPPTIYSERAFVSFKRGADGEHVHKHGPGLKANHTRLKIQPDHTATMTFHLRGDAQREKLKPHLPLDFWPDEIAFYIRSQVTSTKEGVQTTTEGYQPTGVVGIDRHGRWYNDEAGGISQDPITKTTQRKQ